MINNNHMVKVTTIKYYIADSIVCKPNEYSDECTMSLEYLFTWHYTVGARKICRLELINRL